MKYRLINVLTNKYYFNNKLDTKKDFKLMPSFGKGVVKVNESTYELYLSFSLHDRGNDLSPYDLDMEIKPYLILKMEQKKKCEILWKIMQLLLHFHI